MELIIIHVYILSRVVNLSSAIIRAKHFVAEEQCVGKADVYFVVCQAISVNSTCSPHCVGRMCLALLRE